MMPSFITQDTRRLLGYILVAIVSIMLLVLLGAAVWKIPQMQVASLKEQIDLLRNLSTQSINFKDIATLEKLRIDAENAARTVMVQGIGGSFVFLTAFVAFLNYRETRRNVTVAEEKQVTERFSKAIEQLGNANSHVRLGAIYALERISKDSAKDYWQVMEILTAYVRETSPYLPIKTTIVENKPLWEIVLSTHQKSNHSTVRGTKKDALPIATDIQAVLTVITRRAKSYEQDEEYSLDFSKSDLHRSRLSDANLSGANLCCADLKDADLSGADLSGTDLRRADLRGTNLSGADLKRAKLNHAFLNDAIIDSHTKLSNKWCLVWEIVTRDVQGGDLSGRSLKDAELSGVDLSGTNLSDVDLSGAYLWNTNLSGASLCRANLNGASFKGTNLSGANLSDANLSGVNLSDAIIDSQTKLDNKWRLVWEILTKGALGRDLSAADLSLTILTCSDLSGANLSSANLSRANLNYANLSRAIINSQTKLNNKWRLIWEIVTMGAQKRDLSGRNLSDANLSCVDLSGTNLRRVHLHRTNLSGANLCRANLSGVYFRDTNLSGASLCGTNLSSANFRNTNLSGANLCGANLSGVRLGNADLSGANLSGTDLSGANLSDTNLSVVNLSGAIIDSQTKLDNKY